MRQLPWLHGMIMCTCTCWNNGRLAHTQTISSTKGVRSLFIGGPRILVCVCMSLWHAANRHQPAANMISIRGQSEDLCSRVGEDKHRAHITNTLGKRDGRGVQEYRSTHANERKWAAHDYSVMYDTWASSRRGTHRFAQHALHTQSYVKGPCY